MKFDLTGKSAVVTGGASGIGHAICVVLAEYGAHVHILDMNLEYAHGTIQEIQEKGGVAEAHICNVANKEKVNEVINSIAKKVKIDILVNNAGIAHVGNLENTKEEDLDKLYQVNIKGVYNCAQAVIDTMKQNGGVIINMASVASSVGIFDRFAYSMTKGAVLAMTYSIAKDYIKYGIRCNCISPARIHTAFVDGFIEKNYPDNKAEMFEKLSKTQPVGRMGSPEEVANLALYLCSDEASFITGSNYALDGGFVTLNGN
ncbi:SDR family NAD(P)-dependent oxidoreductase [Confluentibacter sediminis]|uniref:SDR family NAD(P)-dependent oxidoreductase n=1 Tax=Confluentibacter sediminis TaxID=2219045 RepID=UPI000DAEDCAD|nr:SDR family oxidoreductase [Confluentibacter sediminis]